jgi:serine phosphatase RsbU (regulator of sigma subunit)/pSer/pThr/pTyr-binding forkhead associated (FHA) protein
MVMGRHPSCQIVLDNAAVSRNHAQILESHGTYYLEDLRSRNGTLLNGKKVSGRAEIRDQDEIRVCEVVLQFFEKLPPDSDEESIVVTTPTVLGDSKSGDDRKVTVSDTDLAGMAITGAFKDKQLDELSSDSSSIITSLDVTNRSPRIAVRPEAKLRAVMEISQNLARALKIEEVLPKILESLFKIFPQADRGFIVLKNPVTGALQVQSLRMRRDNQGESARLSTTILREAMNKARAILSADASKDFALSESVANLKIRSVMCAPLVAQAGEAQGAIQIDTHDHSVPFTEDDLEVLTSVAAQAALSLENAHMHSAALRQRDYERDLDFATQVQLGFLPSERPRVEGYEFFDFYEAAQRVGGDFFDYVMLPDGRVAVTVGDVAGKGLPAALLMARIYSDTRYELLIKPTPADAMTSLNTIVCSSGLGHRFITLAMVVLDPAAHQLTVVNAGHLPPLLKAKRAAIKSLGTEVSGLPLGIQPGTQYRQVQVPIAAGESIVLATDGVTEAMNASNEIYSTARLTAFIKTAPSKAGPLGEAIVADVESYCAGIPQRDDICLICFHRLTS